MTGEQVPGLPGRPVAVDASGTVHRLDGVRIGCGAAHPSGEVDVSRAQVALFSLDVCRRCWPNGLPESP